MNKVKDTTLLAIDGTGTELHSLIEIFEKINCKLKFDKYKILTSDHNLTFHPFIQIIKIPKLNYATFNYFCVKQLNNYVDTKYVLTIQTDGYIVNYDKWNDIYFDYDYIGAPWYKDGEPYSWVKEGGDKVIVGNGGFSFRSKKLLQLLCDLDDSFIVPYINRGFNEDVIICYVLNDLLRSKNIFFAPLSVAATFSLETKSSKFSLIDSVFGFHGKPLLEEVQKYMEKKYV